MISILPGCRTSRVPWRRGRTGTAHVDLERIHFAIAEAVDCVRDVGEQLGDLRLVARGYRLACLLALGVPGHGSRVVVASLEIGGAAELPTQARWLVVEDAPFAAQCGC